MTCDEGDAVASSWSTRAVRRRGGCGGTVVWLLGCAAFVSVVALVLLMVVPPALGARVLSVSSPSMEPVLPVGSLVLVAPADAETLTSGDIVTVQEGDSSVTHRVVENRIVEGELVLRGDANAEADPAPASYDALIGRVVWSAPVLGSVLEAASLPLGRLYLLALAVCGLMLMILGSRIRYNRSR